jgi:hypothetical protein
MAEGAAPPDLDGFRLIESRRSEGTRGGIATYIRKPLQVENTQTNEYGILVKLLLPNSTRINIFNIYIPPASSLRKRNITEQTATK